MNRRSGRLAAALADYDRALELANNQAERRYLTRARRDAEEAGMPMPSFSKSPPELVARFGELAELTGDEPGAALQKSVDGGRTWEHDFRVRYTRRGAPG